VGAIRIISRAKRNTVVKAKAAEMLNVTNLPKAFNIQSRNEMDTMADTSCAGTNWTPIYFTGETVDVAPFAPDHYKPFKQMPVATCATIITTQSGREWFVIGNEMLYFGEKMDRSLINPNQIQMNGIRVDDNPTEEVFGISAKGLFIPFESKGTTVYWDSRAPTFDKIDDLDIPHLVITADEPWDPQAIDMQPFRKQTTGHNCYHPDIKFEGKHMSKVLKEPLRPIETISLGDEHDGIWGEDGDVYIEKRFAQKLIKAV
jgi:hypothetical protein